MKRLLLTLVAVLMVGISLHAQEGKALKGEYIIGSWKYNGNTSKGELEFLPDSSFNINARMTRSFDGFGVHIDAAVNIKGKGMWSIEEDSVLHRFIDVESLDIDILNVNVPGVDPDLVERGIWMAKENAMEPVKNWLHEHPEVLTSMETVVSLEPDKFVTHENRDGDLEKTTYKRK